MSTTTSAGDPAAPAAADTRGDDAPSPDEAPAQPKGWWLPFALARRRPSSSRSSSTSSRCSPGIWISFLQLTKFFIANWGAAPFVGLKNYPSPSTSTARSAQGCCSRSSSPCGFTILVVGHLLGLGMAAAVALQRKFAGRGFFRTLFLVPYALPMYAGIIAWKFMFQKDTGAVNHLLFDNLHLPGGQAVLADRRQRLRRRSSSSRSGDSGRSRS